MLLGSSRHRTMGTKSVLVSFLEPGDFFLGEKLCRRATSFAACSALVFPKIVLSLGQDPLLDVLLRCETPLCTEVVTQLLPRVARKGILPPRIVLMLTICACGNMLDSYHVCSNICSSSNSTVYKPGATGSQLTSYSFTAY
jgi:hypothetical protein